MRLFLIGLLAALPLLFGSPVKAQTKSQVTAKSELNRFLVLNGQGKLKSASAKNILTGEATRFSQMDRLATFSAPDSFQIIDSRHMVARVQELNGKTPVADVYIYLKMVGSTWKVSALRSMAMTGWIETVVQEMRNKPTLTNRERAELANLKLTLSLDRDLRIYFKSNRAKFEKLKTLAIQKSPATDSYSQQLHLNGISNEDSPNLKISVGGMVDNTVGYIYSPSNQPPKISESEYIWVEKIADKWYLFRTT